MLAMGMANGAVFQLVPQRFRKEIGALFDKAFRRFADRHVGRMLRLAQSILGSAAEADEVAQEALRRVWRHAARWDAARGQPGTWVHTNVARLCVDRLRQRRHCRQHRWESRNPCWQRTTARPSATRVGST